MAMTVYDALAHAAQAAFAEREPSEEARAAKIRLAFTSFGHADLMQTLAEALAQTAPAKGKKVSQEG